MSSPSRKHFPMSYILPPLSKRAFLVSLNFNGHHGEPKCNRIGREDEDEIIFWCKKKSWLQCVSPIMFYIYEVIIMLNWLKCLANMTILFGLWPYYIPPTLNAIFNWHLAGYTGHHWIYDNVCISYFLPKTINNLKLFWCCAETIAIAKDPLNSLYAPERSPTCASNVYITPFGRVEG